MSCGVECAGADVLGEASSSLPCCAVLSERCRAILRCADGLPSKSVAAELGIHEHTVGKWRRRFLKDRCDGLLDEAALAPSNHQRRSGCCRDRADVAYDAGRCDTLVDPLDGCGNWLFPHHDPSNVVCVRLAAAPQPDIQVVERSLFVDKVRDIVGLYLSPPNRALVLSIDEKSQIQALDREQPVLPMMPGVPERRTHSYVRHGTTSLFAALDVASGFVIGKCYKRHRAVEFLKFLKEIDAQFPEGLDVHIVLDNYATHKTPKIKAWLARRPHYHVHFTPTSASWINQIERWFAELTRKQIQRIPHIDQSTRADIQTFIDVHNRNLKPFKWTKSADQILLPSSASKKKKKKKKKFIATTPALIVVA